MKEMIHNNDLNDLILALQDTILYLPDTPIIKPSTDNFIEYDGMSFSLDGQRKDSLISLTSTDSQCSQQPIYCFKTKREKRIKKFKPTHKKVPTLNGSNL